MVAEDWLRPRVARLQPWLVSGGYLGLLMAGAHVGTVTGWRWTALALLPLALVAWIAALRRARMIADTPTSTIASAAQGWVELHGQGRRLDGEPLRDPVRQLPCLWWRFRIERRKGRDWVVDDEGTSTTPFLIDDGSGQCLVDPEGAEVLPARREQWTQGGRRTTLELLLPGEAIYVVGGFRTEGGAALPLSVHEDVGHLLAEWKRDGRALLQQHDRNGDGQIDLHEWEQVRQRARREVEQQHRELRAAPSLHLIEVPPDGRTMLISSLPPERLQRRYLRWAWVHAAMFLGALALAASLARA